MRAGVLLTVFLAAPSLGWAQQPCTTDVDSVVEAAYRQVLERAAGRESAGMASALTNGRMTVRELIRVLAKSPDHRQRFLGTGNGPGGRDAAVTNLYRHLLGRQPDPEGLRSQAAAFTNGNPDPIIDGLIDSQEYRTAFGEDTVPGARIRYCGRQTDTRGGASRGDSRADSRGDSRGNAQGDSRGNAGTDTRGDSRSDVPGNSRADSRDDSRGNAGGDPRGSAVPSGPVRFEGMDRSRNGAVERDEWDGTRTAFDTRDWNRDGVLSGDEVRPGARRSARSGAEEDFTPGGSPSWTTENFRGMDRNRDNRLTANEWFYEAEFFRRADRNRDGALAIDEFAGTGWDDDRDVRFDDLDLNRDRRIDRREWQGSVEAFRWLDRNNDNVLSRMEVVGETDSRFDSFAGLDVNRNGAIGLDEWRWSRRSFDRYDVNRDGRLTRQEFAVGGERPAANR